MSWIDDEYQNQLDQNNKLRVFRNTVFQNADCPFDCIKYFSEQVTKLEKIGYRVDNSCYSDNQLFYSFSCQDKNSNLRRSVYFRFAKNFSEHQLSVECYESGYYSDESTEVTYVLYSDRAPSDYRLICKEKINILLDFLCFQKGLSGLSQVMDTNPANSEMVKIQSTFRPSININWAKLVGVLLMALGMAGCVWLFNWALELFNEAKNLEANTVKGGLGPLFSFVVIGASGIGFIVFLVGFFKVLFSD